MLPDMPVPPDRPAVVRIGEWVVYPRLCRATRAGEPVHLRAQLIDLLLILARRPNVIVSREEVMAALWPGVHMSGSALSRCMAELRQAFDDDVRNPWLVETIAKRGYRVIAPVQIEDEPAGTALAEPPAAGPAADAPAPPPAEAGPVATPLRRQVPPTLRAVPALFALVVVAKGAWMAISWRRPAAALSGRETLVLADVVNTTGDASFDGTIRLALAIQLEQAPLLRILSDERVRDTLALMRRRPNEPVTGATALEVCRREGAAVVLAGSVARLGKRLAVGVEAIGCGQGDSIARVIEEAEGPEGVLAAVGRVASAVRARLGESPASLRTYDVPVARATTASLHALRALSLGDAKRDEGRIEDALEELRAAEPLPTSGAPPAWVRTNALLALGRLDEAKRALDNPRFQASLGTGASILRARIAWLEGHADAARAELDRTAALGGGAAYGTVMERAAFAVAEGRLVEGRRLFAEVVSLAATVGEAQDVATTHLLHALAEAAVGHAAPARQAVAAGLSALRNRDTHLRAAMALAQAGDGPGARRALDAGVRAPVFNARQDAIWIATVGAAAEGADRPAPALERLGAVQPYERGLEFSLISLAVRAQLLPRAGRPKEAVEACREFLRLRGVDPASPFLAPIRVTLARALASLGDKAASREAYETFFQSSPAADAGVPLLLAARAEHAALGPSAPVATAGRQPGR
jgi:DNA-binding winged helix-turn-helix (wHTH) protein/tetratricopeptide (TPR) repeat protein